MNHHNDIDIPAALAGIHDVARGLAGIDASGLHTVEDLMWQLGGELGNLHADDRERVIRGMLAAAPFVQVLTLVALLRLDVSSRPAQDVPDSHVCPWCGCKPIYRPGYRATGG